MASSEEDPRSKRGGHRLFDHSSFPDIVILRVRDKNFTISASYLALHSPFFYDLFYGPKSNGLNGRYELDYDPHIFGDLLDMIYPCYKKICGCVECSSYLDHRLTLALQLELRFAVKRMIMDNPRKGEVISTLQKNNAWHSYSYLVGDGKDPGGKNEKYDASNVLDPLHVSMRFPDSTTMIFNGVTVLVSASTLSLHSSVLGEMLYKDGKLTEGLKIEADSFLTFLQATTGYFPSECSCKFLDDLLILGAKPLYEYNISEMNKKMRREEGSQCLMQLLEHYSNQSTLNRNSLNNLVRHLSVDKLQTILSNSSSLSHAQKTALWNNLDEATAYQFRQVFVKNLSAPGVLHPYTIKVSKEKENVGGEFVVEYDVIKDEYSIGGETRSGFFGSLAAGSGIQRKVERDWRRVYISREEGSHCQEGSMEWNIDLDGVEIDSVTVEAREFLQKEGCRVILTVCSGDSSFKVLPGRKTKISGADLTPGVNLQLKAQFVGWKRVLSYQHAQLFRADIDDPRGPHLEMRFKLKDSTV